MIKHVTKFKKSGRYYIADGIFHSLYCSCVHHHQINAGKLFCI